MVKKTYNSSITGRYVSKEYADKHKSTTQSHVVKDKPQKGGTKKK